MEAYLGAISPGKRCRKKTYGGGEAGGEGRAKEAQEQRIEIFG